MSLFRCLLVCAFFLLFCIAFSCSSGDRDQAINLSGSSHPVFAGDKTCQSCHTAEWNEWSESHHAYAIAEADDESVLGDFSNTTFSYKDQRYRFFKNEGVYFVEIHSADEEPQVYEISYTFGWEPLQQYLIGTEKGKMQALHIAWDTEENKWFTLQPDESYKTDDWMHWTGGSMNWNTMCADCHSTNLQQNYIAEADSFHTTWSLLNVSCEACHGPGQQHVDFMNSAEGADASRERIREDLLNGRFASQMEEINTCAPCHSLRQKLTDSYIHGDPYFDHFDPQLIHPDYYFADGQIRDEVYVYGSFLQSKMFAEGVQCSDCHNPHSLQLKESLVDNKLCMTCHEPQYNTSEHHFHEPNTESSQCISCHMDGRTYMGNDYRKDHSFRVPRPDQSVEYGTPNSCNSCHTDQTPEWAADAIVNWYGEERAPHFSEVLLKVEAGETGAQTSLNDLIGDETQPDIIRATAVWYAGQFQNNRSNDAIQQALRSDSEMIRTSAVKAAEKLEPELRRLLLTDALSDKFRSVRLFAFRSLASFSDENFEQPYRDHFLNAMQEYLTSLEINRYFPQGEMNRGQHFEQQGETEKAVLAYRSALERDPYFNPARINLAYLLNSRGENREAEELLRTVTIQEPDFGQAFYSLGLLLAEEDRLDEAVEYFEEAALKMPGNSRVRYNMAIAYQTLDQPARAESAYLEAIGFEPANGDFRYGLITLYMQQEKFGQALEQALKLEEIYPGNEQIQQLIHSIRQRTDR